MNTLTVPQFEVSFNIHLQNPKRCPGCFNWFEEGEMLPSPTGYFDRELKRPCTFLVCESCASDLCEANMMVASIDRGRLWMLRFGNVMDYYRGDPADQWRIDEHPSEM